MQYFLDRKLISITWFVCMVTWALGTYRILTTGDEGIVFAVAGTAMYMFIVPAALSGFAAMFKRTRKPTVIAWIFLVCTLLTLWTMFG